MQLPEFTHEARGRSHRRLGQRAGVTLQSTDHRRWHARCYWTCTSQHRSEIGREGSYSSQHTVSSRVKNWRASE